MAEKILEFDVRIIQSRRYRIPYNKAVEILKEEYGNINCEKWSECEMADVLYPCSEIKDYEDNDYYEYNYGTDYEITNAELSEE